MSIRTISPAVVIAGVVTAAGLTLATGGPAVAATAARASAGSVQLTGTQLLSALLPASSFPAGYKLDKSNNYDSGKSLENSAAKYHVSTMSCSSFSNQFGKKGFGETAVAGSAYGAGSLGTSISSVTSKTYGQQAYQFKTSSAAVSFYQGTRGVFNRCLGAALGEPSSDGHITVRVSSAASIGGHQTFQVTISGTASGLKLGESIAITQAGKDVFFAGAVGINTAVPASPSFRTVMLKLINRVSAFR
jgi:hypothetical protein